MDVQQARFNMIHQQIRPWDVADDTVLQALEAVPRENYVPEAYRSMAFVDMQIPLGHGEFMMEPKVEARLLQELGPVSGHRVCEIGTGSGYVTALLAHLGAKVTSVDIRPEFTSAAANRLESAGFSKVQLVSGDASSGWDDGAPWDGILVTGSLPLLPESLRKSLAPGGRLIVIVGEDPVMEALSITRQGDNEWTTVSIFDTRIPPLMNAATPSKFTF